MSESSMGGFGRKTLKRINARNNFISARVDDVAYSKEVEYTSGPVGSRITHKSTLNVVSRWVENENRDIRIRGVDPELFLELWVNEINETVLVSMDTSDLVQFGEFSSLQRGNFHITVDEVDVKVGSDSVKIKDVGSFDRETDLRGKNWESYSERKRNKTGMYDHSYNFGSEVRDRLREAWAKENGVYSSMWTVENVDDYEFSSRATVCAEPTADVCGGIKFSVSMKDWDDNASLRALVEKDCEGDISNLEGEKVFVSLAEYNRRDPVSESGSWNMYRAGDKPNIVSRTVEKYL